MTPRDAAKKAPDPHKVAAFMRANKVPLHNRGGLWDRDENGQYFANKVGRNEPCPCGSGEKAKRCKHGRGVAP